MSEGVKQKEQDIFSGNILLFYAFDIGDDISFDIIKNRGLLTVCEVPLSGYFKHYHVPLSFRLQDYAMEDEAARDMTSCIVSKLYHFGVVSFCYRVPFEGTLDELKTKTIQVKKEFDYQAELDAKHCFESISSAITSPHFYNQDNSYFAVQVHPRFEHDVSSEKFKEKYGGKVASLLKLEQQALSDYQKDKILASTIGYYGEDWIIIDSEGSFIYDDEYFEPLEFLESINVQKLELQYFDRLLDHKLEFFYAQKQYSLPRFSYIPLMHEYIDSPVSRLAKLRVDISVITERLENSIKLADDSYYAQIYHLLVEKLSIKEWRDSINRKLVIIQDLYRVYQDRLDTIHEQILTVVIIVLIAFEALLFIISR